MAKLLSCPFCGGEAKFETYGGTACAVVCESCHCGTATVRLDDGMQAVEAWNCRAERTCRVDSSHERECDQPVSWFEYELDCGHTVYWDSQIPPSYCPECGRKVVCDVADYV